MILHMRMGAKHDDHYDHNDHDDHLGKDNDALFLTVRCDRRGRSGRSVCCMLKYTTIQE
jgi:hypothetical protein